MAPMSVITTPPVSFEPLTEVTSWAKRGGIGPRWSGLGVLGALLRPLEKVSWRIEWLTGSIEHLILLTDILLSL